jgi:hypothetical protein
VENEKAYEAVVPYYIAQIYYIQGKKEEAIAYAEKKIKGGNAQYYDREMKLMLGMVILKEKNLIRDCHILKIMFQKQKRSQRRTCMNYHTVIIWRVNIQKQLMALNN